jgi:ATP-dependent DNA helicase RecG
MLPHKLIASWENEIVEFKGVGDSYKTSEIGHYFSALANEANLTGVGGGWLVFGIENRTRSVIGTDYRTDSERLHGLKRQIAQGADPSMTFRDIHVLDYDGHRVIMFDIPPAPQGIPVAWNGHFYARDGESLTSLSLSEQDRIRQQTVNRDWTAVTLPEAELRHLDPDALLAARRGFAQRHSSRLTEDEVLSWTDDVFLERAKLTRDGKITRAAVLLVGRTESWWLLSPNMAQITWALQGPERGYEHFGPPFLLTTGQLYDRIRNIEIQLLRPDSLVPVRIPKYDRRMVLEAIHNALAHQEYSYGTRMVVIERSDRLIITNHGSFYDGSPEEYAEGNAVPNDYRNPQLAQAMSELGMIDSLGFGIHDMVTRQVERFLPLPQYELASDHVDLTIYGSMIDPAYSSTLMLHPNLPLPEVIALDRVQKQLPIGNDEIERLRDDHLIVGRKPRFLVAPVVNDSEEMGSNFHAEPSAKDLASVIVSALSDGAVLTRVQVDRLVWDMFRDLDDADRSARISRALTSMRKAGQITNAGTRSDPEWRLAD